MFTGLIETVGTVVQISGRGNYSVLSIKSALSIDEIALGDSIACNGACLTVVEKSGDQFVVEASQETLKLTTVGDLNQGDKLNLERALQVGSRLGGHFVQGHVDTTGRVQSLKSVGESLELKIEFDKKYDPLVVNKGSIAINGVSLTINKATLGVLSVNIIPHTADETTLETLKSGDRVNLEFDLIGKYILKTQGKGAEAGVTADFLKESGW